MLILHKAVEPLNYSRRMLRRVEIRIKKISLKLKRLRLRSKKLSRELKSKKKRIRNRIFPLLRMNYLARDQFTCRQALQIKKIIQDLRMLLSLLLAMLLEILFKNLRRSRDHLILLEAIRWLKTLIDIMALLLTKLKTFQSLNTQNLINMAKLLGPRNDID